MSAYSNSAYLLCIELGLSFKLYHRPPKCVSLGSTLRFLDSLHGLKQGISCFGGLHKFQ